MISKCCYAQIEKAGKDGIIYKCKHCKKYCDIYIEKRDIIKKKTRKIDLNKFF